MKNFILYASLVIVNALSAQNFIKRTGTKLSMGGEEIVLRGMSFGNRVWENVALPSGHHTEADIARIHDLGMNAIRFYMNYRTFEDDSRPYTYKQAGWDWLDQNIAWAKKHHVYLILNMHVPQGGFQSQCKGEALWKVQDNQDRFVALWKNIAQRYSSETQIAGYDLLNEPTPSDSVMKLQHLLQKTIDAIRTVDANHMIIAERALALGCDYGYNDGKYNYPILKEDNLMYTVHMYEPFEYTHQNQSWANTGDGGSYPDPSKISPPGDLAWGIGQYNNASVPVGTSDWTYYVGKPFLVSDAKYIIARPVFYGHRLGSGIAYYDDITINEVDAQGNVLKEIVKWNVNDLQSVWHWSENGDGSMSTSFSGHGDKYSITNTGTTGNSSITLGRFTFKVENGKRYAISGWMKGDNIPSGATTALSMELYYSPSGSPVYARNKQYLKSVILQTSQYPSSKGYPVYFGEFGVVRNAFENNKGGERWVADVIDIFDSLGYSWTYHVYREGSFGLYNGVTGTVDTNTVNTLLKNTFIAQLKNPTDVSDGSYGLDIKIYPNPSKNVFHIELPAATDVELVLTNMQGTKLLSKTYSNTKDINFGEHLDKGVYLCTLKTHHKIFTYKLTKN